MKVKVIDLFRYRTFKDLIDNFGPEYYGYNKNYSLNDLLDNIYKIYPKKEEEKYGVLGIKIKVLT